MNNLVLSAVVPLVVGPITFILMQAIKNLSPAVDALPPVAKRFAVAAIAVALTTLAQLAGVDLVCDPDATTNCLSTLDKDAVKSIVAAAIAYLLHFAKPKNK